MPAPVIAEESRALTLVCDNGTGVGLFAGAFCTVDESQHDQHMAECQCDGAVREMRLRGRHGTS